MDVFSGHDVNVGVSIATLDKRIGRLWEPRASSVEERLRVVEAAQKAGLRTTIMFAPLLPFLSDGPSSLAAMFQLAADLRVDSILVDALNPRPRVWPSVAGLLRKHFPELQDRYCGILFNPQIRAEYLAEFRNNVALTAQRLSLEDRVTECF